MKKIVIFIFIITSLFGYERKIEEQKNEPSKIICENTEIYSVEDFICNDYELARIEKEEISTFQKLLELENENKYTITKEHDDWIQERNKCELLNQKEYLENHKKEKEEFKKINNNFNNDIYIGYKLKEIKEKLKNTEFYKNRNDCLYEKFNNREDYYINKLTKYINEENINFIMNKSIGIMSKNKLDIFKDELNKDERTKENSLEIISCEKGYQTLAGTINSGYSGLCNAKKDKKIIKINICYNMAFAFDFEEINNKEEENKIDIKIVKKLLIDCYGG